VWRLAERCRLFDVHDDERASGAEHPDEAVHGRLRIGQVAQDEARMHDVVCGLEIEVPQVLTAVIDVVGAGIARLRAGELELRFVEIDSDDAPGVGSPGELERDVAPSASDIEAVCVLRDPDAIEQLAGAGRHDPRDEAQPLAPL
jgi:hypothetical protein